MDLLEVVLTTEGLMVTLLERDMPEGVEAHRTFKIHPANLGEDAVEGCNEFLDLVRGWVERATTRQEEPDHGPYDNPEEVDRWGPGDD